MSQESFDLDSHLSRIETRWSVVHRARDEGLLAREAQSELLARYGAAIKRYLTAALRDDTLADEIFQEFALKFVRGDLDRVDQTRGKFRYYVKAVLYNLIRTHFRQAGRRQTVTIDHFEPTDQGQESTQVDDLFLSNWRDELLSRTWTMIEDEERSGRNSHYTTLRTRVEMADASYDDLAPLLGKLLAREITPKNARVLVHRARDRFAQLLINCVADTLESPRRETIEAELAELRLLPYCKDLLSV